MRDTSSQQAAGLVFAYRGVPGSAPRPLDAADIPAALAASDGWVWLHMDLIDHRARGWIGRCTLPDEARALFEGHDETLALTIEDGVVSGVCPDFRREFDGRPTEAQTIALGRMCFAIGARLLVTGRRQPLTAVDDVRHALKTGRLAPDGPFDLFEAVVTGFCRATMRRLATAMGELDAIEDRIVTERTGDERQALNVVRRLCLALHRPAATLLSAYRSEERDDWPLPDDAQAVLQRLAGRLQALVNELMQVEERTKLLLDEVAALQADQMNRSLRALALVSTLLLPGALVAGIFGMNTHDLPFAETAGGFWWAVGLVAASTLFFIWILHRSGVRLRL